MTSLTDEQAAWFKDVSSRIGMNIQQAITDTPEEATEEAVDLIAVPTLLGETERSATNRLYVAISQMSGRSRTAGATTTSASISSGMAA